MLIDPSSQNFITAYTSIAETSRAPPRRYIIGLNGHLGILTALDSVIESDPSVVPELRSLDIRRQEKAMPRTCFPPAP